MREFARPTNLREVVARFVATRQECRVPVGGARQEGRMVGPVFRYNADMNMKGFVCSSDSRARSCACGRAGHLRRAGCAC